jgi:hypothetical protein
MTLPDSTTLASDLAEAVRAKLLNAPAPLKLAEVVKGLPKPRKTKPADFRNQVRLVLDEQIRLGQVFISPSGKNGEMRYWSRDERHLLREKALEFASTPQTLAAMKTKLKSEVKGVEPAYVQSVIDELISQKELFDYPAKRGSRLLGATPPPPPLPPLEQPKHAKALNKLITDCQKLLAATNVPVEELLQAVRKHLRPSPAAEPGVPSAERETVPPSQPPMGGRETLQPPSAVLPPPRPTPDVLRSPRAELDELILKALAHAPVHSLAELRASMPAEYRGSAFDEAVLRLADEQQVILSQDALPERFSEAEKVEYVRDGDAVFTTIAKWS